MRAETPVLSRLGPVPFWRGEGKCLDRLEEIYRKAMQSAEARLLRETREAPPPSRGKGAKGRMR